MTAVTEANGNLPEDQLDNRRRESNNNPAWVSLLHSGPTDMSVLKVESSRGQAALFSAGQFISITFLGFF